MWVVYKRSPEFNSENGFVFVLANQKTVFCFKINNIQGLPDGMTIDQEGMLWIACFGSAQVNIPYITIW